MDDDDDDDDEIILLGQLSEGPWDTWDLLPAWRDGNACRILIVKYLRRQTT
jgi:hypothetical protein